MNVTFEIVKNSPEIRTYITQADASLTALGFTEHSFAHVTKCAEVAARILTQLGYSPKEVELAKIAAFMHDIGNVVNRHDHAISGATMAFRILDKMGMEPADVACVITAIGHHDDSTAFPVNAIAAASSWRTRPTCAAAGYAIKNTRASISTTGSIMPPSARIWSWMRSGAPSPCP